MEDYWKVMNDYPPIFTNIDWNSNNNSGTNDIDFLPIMEFDNNKTTSYQHQPFQRRRSSSVDLPINPLYSNTNKLIINEPTIQEEEFIMPQTRMNRIGSSATLEFPGHFTTTTTTTTTTSSSNYTESPLSTVTNNSEQLPPPSEQQQQHDDITFFPELHRTSYNTILGKQLKQHQKRRRSSSLPPAFHRQPKQHIPTPLIFTQIQVTDPTPIQHTQKAAKVDTRPVAIERVHKPQPKIIPCDPIETQKKLDEQLIQLNFEDVTVAELKEMLRDRGLPATGKKAILTDRLKDARDILVKSKSKNWSISPNIQSLANMTIHSPIPPTQSLFMPMEDCCEQQQDTILFQDLDHSIHPGVVSNKQEQQQPSISPTQSFENYQHDSIHPGDSSSKQSSVSPNTSHDNYDMHHLNHVSPHQPLENYHYSEELDMNDLFNFDTLMNTTQQNNNNNNVRHNSEWDQDKLDFFLKELI